MQGVSPESLCGAFLLQWKENLTLTETQVQALALNRQAGQELDVKRREAIYNDVLTKQQMVRKKPSVLVVCAGRSKVTSLDGPCSIPPTPTCTPVDLEAPRQRLDGRTKG